MFRTGLALAYCMNSSLNPLQNKQTCCLEKKIDAEHVKLIGGMS